MRCGYGLALAFAVAAPAAAQDNAIRAAGDAFGERVGIEQSGLYSESQVRGFDLNDSGGYRIDDAYFNRAAALDDTILSGVSVRVGGGAAQLAYPAPSGVVDYRLRKAAATSELRLGVGLRDYGTAVLQADGSVREGALSLAGGVLWRPLWRYAQGYRGEAFSAGAVAAWDLSAHQRLRVFAAAYARGYDGDYAVVPVGGAMPPPLRSFHQYSPSGARTAAVSTNLGLLYHGEAAGFGVDLTVFHSVFGMRRFDYTLIFADPAGQATATTYRSPRNDKTSDSAELRLSRAFGTGELRQVATLSVRGGRTETELVSSLAIPLGAFDLRHSDPPGDADMAWSGTRGLDRAEQLTASAGYALAWRDKIQLRVAAHRTRYDKAVSSVAGVHTRRTTETTHYNVSTIANLGPRTTVFGSWVTGLEETGTAPPTATNRDEVLPPGETEQFEVGVRRQLSPGLTFIGALFDVTKPSIGFRSDGAFGAVGEVRHRGAEASITGRLDAKTSVVVGAMAFESRVTGPLVGAGAIGRHDPGVSRLAISANLEHRLSESWSVDASLSYSGPRWADTANSFEVPGFMTANLGVRDRFAIADHRAELRVLASNISRTRGYVAARSGLLTAIPPPTIRAVLTVSLAPGPR